MSSNPLLWLIAITIALIAGLYANYRHTNPGAPKLRQLYVGLRDAWAWSRIHGRKGQR